MIPPCCGAPLPSPKTVSISIPWVMYMSAPASATTLSPGSSSTSTNCMSSPSILKSISWARRPGGGGGVTGERGPAQVLASSARPGASSSCPSRR